MNGNLLYRFRDLNNLLIKYQELKNQQIYFSDPESLNDPMEELRDVIWSGDQIVWTNLFRHYIMCLQWTSQYEATQGCKTQISSASLPIGQLPNGISWDNLRDTYNTNISYIFELAQLNELIEVLSEHRIKVRRSELTYFLQMIPPIGICCRAELPNRS